ncbi:MAG: hypothetical protein WBS24_19015 [Terriglobales bacterium]
MSTSAELRALFQRRIVQLLALAILLSIVAARSLQLKFCVLDLDVWWHLKVGDWIIQHLAVPRTGIFSRTAANRPWVAYSWGYEVLLSLAYRWFDLVGIGIYGVLLTLAVSYSIFWMALRLSGQFWRSCLIAALACSAFLYDIMPRPVFFSMTLFTIVLALLLEANRAARIQLLYWLPPLFLLWANLHIQFIYGLFLVGLFVGVNIAQRLADYLRITPEFILPPTLPASTLAAIFAACAIATCFGPYTYHLFPVVYQYSKAKVPYSIILELQPINFRGASHYVQLLLTCAAFFALGWRKKIDLFKFSLLTIATVVAYRTMRDSWFICIPAAAVLADSSHADFSPPDSSAAGSCAFESSKKTPLITHSHRDPLPSWPERAGLAAFVAIALVLFATNTDFNERGLDRAISNIYPVNAVNFLRRNPQLGPLYNNLDWGGFLIWYMPDFPVAIDGRNDLYGDDLDRLFYDTEMGRESYSTDPYLSEAGVVLLERRLPLAQLLTADPRFTLIYQDQLTAVFAPTNPSSAR